jgi:transposase InsO family protein
MEIESIGGARYLLTFIDDKTRMTFVSFLKTKDEVFSKFVQFKTYIEKQTGKCIKAIRTDRGKEYVNNQMMDYFQKHGIHHQKTIAYTPEQNGVSERCNRTLVERARAMLTQANLSSNLWAEAIYTANYSKNRSPTIALQGKTPIEAWTGEKPDLSHMKTFGCRAFIHIPKSQRKKWDNKAKEMIFVGYSVDSKGYRLMDPNTSKITEARDIVFIENEYCTPVTESQNAKKVLFYDEELVFPILQQNVSTTSDAGNTSVASVQDTTVSNIPDSPENDNNASSPSKSQTMELRRSTRIPKMPSYLSNYDLSDLHYQCNLSTALDLNEYSDHSDLPSTYQEAVTCMDSQRWKGAIEEELNSHKKNHTWDIVALPADRKPIKCKWVFKIKQNSDGTTQRYKARLVAKGCSQKAGIDYTETFSPVVRYDTLRILIALTTLYDWEIDHVDAVVAFLQGNIDEEIYMECPDGLEVSKERGDIKLVCRLQKAIYGLKQSGRAWYTKLDEALKSFGLTCADFDCCVYYTIQA